MYLRQKCLSRRTLLHGAGISLALPLLDAMRSTSRRSLQVPLRLVYIYIPSGVIMDRWTPQQAGRDFALSPILKPLEPHRKELLILSGLASHNGNELGDGNGDHSRAGASFLTGVHCRKTEGDDIQSGVSADQIAARALAKKTRLPSLELSCEGDARSANCEPGYSNIYTNSISWRSPTTPMHPEINPRAVFQRLFGSVEGSLDRSQDPQRAQRRRQRASILDSLHEDTQSLTKTLGRSDRTKLDEYLMSLRELETQIQQTEQDTPQVIQELAPITGIPLSFVDYANLMFDLQLAAFKTDLTRVSTLMLGCECSMRSYPELGITDSHHPLTHHRDNPERIDKVAQINTLHTTLFARYLDKLKATPDGEGSLLDNSMIVYGSGISDGNRHLHENLPILVAGRGAGRLPTGQHLIYQKETPLANLHMTLLDRLGVHPELFGDSTGTLQELSQF
jgi:Protein of unknown function (DUF1552)